MIKRYVVGFLFEGGHVLLIKKRPGPHYVSGLLNGLGGTIEVGETPDMAMTRESREEAGITLPTGIAWQEFHREFRPDNALHFFCADASDLKYPLVVTKRTDESLHWLPINEITGAPHPGSYSIGGDLDIVPNLHYLVPMAWHWLKHPMQHYSEF